MKDLARHSELWVHQKFELAEFFGFETRNRYEILDERKRPLGYAAEQAAGVKDLIFRQLLGHWRSFTILIFDSERRPVLRAHHPHRWYYQRLDVSDMQGRPLGAMERRFSVFKKSFEVLGPQGDLLFSVSSPLWRIWTFPFMRNGREVAVISKKWSGMLFESLSDKDKFLVKYGDPQLKDAERQLILAAALFIDLLYFEKRASDRT